MTHPNKKPKPNRKRNWIIAAIAVFIGLWALGTLIGPTDNKTAEPEQPSETAEAQEAPKKEEPVETATAEPVEQAEDTPEPSTPEEAIANATGDPQATAAIEPGETGNIIFVTYNIEDMLTKNAITRGAQNATLDTLQAARDSGIDYHRIFIQGYFPLGSDPEPAMVLNAGYDATTVSNIDFDNTTPDRIFSMRDAGMVHQELGG